jgi:hypothetical protein
MALLMKFICDLDWNGHSSTNSTYAMISEEEAAILMRQGIAEPALDRGPEIPFNVRLDTTTRTGRR